MGKIKVLVVDDSAFMRKVITDILSSDPAIEVVDTARDGVWAVEKLKTIKADVVTMDVEMPRMNGLEALKVIRENYNIPVLMLSSLTREGTDITIKALEFGAFDFVLKPQIGSGFNMDDLKDELIGKIKLCCHNSSKTEIKDKHRDMGIPKTKLLTKDIKAVCIAASTGGPKALSQVITSFPKEFKLPILVVQHMPSGFTKAFAARLDGSSNLRVKEAEDGDKIEGGKVYIAPGGYHMVVKSGGTNLSLNKEPAMHGVRPCADKLFMSAAENIKGRLVGIVLTGMGRDGTDGLLAIKEKGGITIAEDESTCTIFGMPRSAIERGVVDIVAPLYDIVNEVLNITGI